MTIKNGTQEETIMKNLYINQLKFFDYVDQENSIDISKKLFGKNWQLHKQALQSQVFSANSWYPRFGTNIGDSHVQTLVNVDLGIDLEHTLALDHLTFADATDRRFEQLIKDFGDRPWLVSWSGGIDSTVILASIIKNLPIEKRNSVVVCCDPSSVWESPVFFYQHILPNFSTVDSTDFYQKFDYYRDKFYIIDGEPADCLWGSRHTPYLGDLAQMRWQQNLTKLIDYIDSTVDHLDSSRWLVESVADNIESVELPIQTISQWFWWVNFNFNYIDTFMRKAYSTSIPLLQLDKFYVNWYHSQEYNIWGIQQQILYHNNADSFTYKLDAKNYVCDLLRNKYWHTFKTKGSSGSRTVLQKNFWISAQEDGKFCYNINNLT
jgi:hypothetical protein